MRRSAQGSSLFQPVHTRLTQAGGFSLLRTMPLIALVLLMLVSCSNNQPTSQIPPTSTIQAATEFTPPTQTAFSPTQIKATKVPPTQTPTLLAPTDTATASISLVETFPLAPGATLDQSSLSEPEVGDRRGYFTLMAPESTALQLADFYASALPNQGWLLRYSDDNYLGGVTQNWRQGNTYLTVEIGYVDNQLVVNSSYERIPQDANIGLPADFNLPEGSELVSAWGSSWTYYVSQDFGQVTGALDQQFQRLGWELGIPMDGSGSECGGECRGSSSFPPGVTPLPSPTPDWRRPVYYAYILPDGDEFYLEASPHQDATILVIDMIFKQVSAAGLPPEVTAYPNAVVQSATPGALLYQSAASPEMVRQYYVDQLSASGWQVDDEPQEGGGLFMARWVKGNLAINIAISPDGSGGSLVNITCEGC